MTKQIITGGVFHTMPDDLRRALSSDQSVVKQWNDLTPLARNEWICWVITNKKIETRKNHIKRTITELLQGKRRPCCWGGCIHRSDKEISPTIKWALSRQKK